ncbi:MAG: carbohydrate ABC transporter permease, partial [Spirochaetales bacterium]|nr:carbohydrate ABC transporter permease [Spirochaetales bacterium]
MKEYTSLPVKIIKHALLLLGCVIMIMPFIWMVSTSFKPNNEVLTWPPKFIPKHWTMANYIRVFEVAPFVKFFFNSLIMSLICTALVIITSTVAGYVFSKFNFPGKTFLFMITLATSMVPLEVYMVPLYLNMVKLRLINTFVALCAPYVIMSYGIFFMRQNVTAT